VSRGRGIPASTAARLGEYRKCESLATQPPYPADLPTSSARALRCAVIRSRLASRSEASVRSTHSSHEDSPSPGAPAILNLAPFPA
jgi:hypothetical protein